MTTGTLALIILAVVLAQFAIVMLLGLYRRRRQYRSLDEKTTGEKHISKANAATLSSAEPVTSDLARQGFKEFIVQGRQMEDANNTVCSFYLVPTDGKPLTTFRPGQFLTFKLQIEDSETIN